MRLDDITGKCHPTLSHGHRGPPWPGRLRTILADQDRYVAGAARVGTSLRALGGPDAVVDTLEELAARA